MGAAHGRLLSCVSARSTGLDAFPAHAALGPMRGANLLTGLTPVLNRGLQRRRRFVLTLHTRQLDRTAQFYRMPVSIRRCYVALSQLAVMRRTYHRSPLALCIVHRNPADLAQALFSDCGYGHKQHLYQVASSADGLHARQYARRVRRARGSGDRHSRRGKGLRVKGYKVLY